MTQCEPSVNKGNVNILSSFTFNPFNSLTPAPRCNLGLQLHRVKTRRIEARRQIQPTTLFSHCHFTVNMVRETETHPAVLVFHFRGRMRSCGSCGRRLSSRRQKPRADPGIWGRGDVLSATGSRMDPSVWVCFYYITL